MVTIAEGLTWRPSALADLAGALRAEARALTESADAARRTLDSVSEDDFAGMNRRAAETAVTRCATSLRRCGISVARLADCCGDSAAMLDDAVSELSAAVAWATALGFNVDTASGAMKPSVAMVIALAHGLGGSLGGPAKAAELQVLASYRLHAALAKLNSLDTRIAEAVTALGPEEAEASGVEPAGSTVNSPTQTADPTHFTHGTPLDSVDQALAERARELGLPSAQLLESSPRHSAIAFGDVQRASTIITLVPGTGSSASEAAKQLERVAATFRASGEAPDNVAVVLFSYDAPANLAAAARPEYYDLAAERLQHLQSELVEDATAGATEVSSSGVTDIDEPSVATHQRHIVAGYSYGATVVAQASVGSGLYADRVLLIASPGAGPSLEHASQMKLLKPDGIAHPASENSHRVAVATSPVDPIRIPAVAGVHGKDPASETFGAHRLDMSERGLSPADIFGMLFTPVQELPEKYSYLAGNPHTEHYFDDEVFERETSSWLHQDK